jgi:hypothetical protein
MESLSQQNASAIRTIMDLDVNIGMNVLLIKIAACKENASTLQDPQCLVNNAIANSDGLVQDAAKVCKLIPPQNLN